jgi:hypothetical protein
MNRRHVLWVAVCACLSLLVAGCPKKDSTNGVTGHVEVDGGSAAGVTIKIYDEPSFDQNSPWPTTDALRAVGFPYSLQAAFDWRQPGSSKRDEVTTDASGNFTAPNLSDGVYVVVAQKDSFGWSTPVRVDLSGKNVDAGTLRLKRDRSFAPSYTIRQDTVWTAGSHIVLQGNLSITGRLTIQPGVVVRLKDDAVFRVVSGGQLICRGTADSCIIFTSDLLVPNNPDWRSIHFDGGASAPEFEYCVFRYCDKGVESNAKGGVIQSCYFALQTSVGVDLTGYGAGASDSLVIRHCVFQHIPWALRAVEVTRTPLVIEHNAVFGSSTYGADLEAIRGGSFFCNLFFDCGRSDTTLAQLTGCLYVRDVRELVISRNEFNSSPVGFTVASRVDSTTLVQFNRFSACSRGIHIGYTPGQEGASYPTLTSNCFDRTGGFNVFIGGCSINTHNVNAVNNYWGSVSENVIISMFWEHDRESACPFVLYNPFLETCPQGQVGICSN